MILAGLGALFQERVKPSADVNPHHAEAAWMRLFSAVAQ